MDYGEAWVQMQTACEPCNVYDIEEGYRDALAFLFQQHHGVSPRLHMGKVQGDVTKVPLWRLEWADILLAGPPCPPWSSQGLRKSQKDWRALVFETIIRWLIFMIFKLGLIGCVLENVKGVTQALGGFQPYYEKLLFALRQCVPQFHWRFDTLHLQQYKTAQMRTRVFLRGLHKMFTAIGIPDPLPPFGCSTLRDFLAWDLPQTPVASLSDCMKKNLCWYQEQIARALDAGRVAPSDVIACVLDRASGKAYKPSWYANVVPTLTTSNQYLFLLVAGEVKMAPEACTLFRFLSMPERFALQGKSPDLAPLLKRRALACKASGNAYPTALMVAVLAPMLRVIGNSGVPLAQPCGPVVTTPSCESVTKKTLAKLRVRKKVLKNKPAKNMPKTQREKRRLKLKRWGSL